MSAIFDNLYRAADVRELDRRAMAECDLGNGKLMERAGAAAFDQLRKGWPTARRIAVIAGSGNNGGDGYVIARLARKLGLDAIVFAVREPKADDAVQAANRYRDAGGQMRAMDAFTSFEADVIVDALMGTGLDRPLEGEFASAVNAVNAKTAGRLAIDIPSGLNADSGAVMGCAVRADCTITFVGAKCGLFTGRAPAFTGALHFADLEIPKTLHADIEPAARRVTFADPRALLPPRERDAHKGHFGHGLILGGDHGMPGAVRMAAEAALRTGAGLVSVYTQPENVGVVAARPEVMCRAGEGLEAMIERASIVAIGPGLGQGDFGRELFNAAVGSDKPLVVDADGLNLLARENLRRGNWILTPHPGEAARLLACSTGEIQNDRFAAARALADHYDAAVVLKGAGTLVAAPGERTSLIDRGNPGMASGGMGDVLTGIITGIWAQTVSAYGAARIGAFVHGVAGDRAAAAGERGLAALDLVNELRGVINP